MAEWGIMEISEGYFKSIQDNLSDARGKIIDLEEAIEQLGLGHQIQAKITEMRKKRAAWKAEDERRRAGYCSLDKKEA